MYTHDMEVADTLPSLEEALVSSAWALPSFNRVLNVPRKGLGQGRSRTASSWAATAPKLRVAA